MPKKTHLASIGSVYLETNYLATETAGKDVIEVGFEYRSSSYTIGLGGSAVNFAVQAVALGLDVSLMGQVGDDDNGKKVLELLTAQGIRSDFIQIAHNVQTGIDTGIVLQHSGQNIQLVSGNANQLISYDDIPLEESLFAEVAAVYLGGYFKQEALFGDYPKLVKKLKEKEKLVFLDHGRVPVDVQKQKIDILRKTLADVDGYFLNDAELFSVTGKQSVDSALREVISWGPKFVVVKQGEKGCTVAQGSDSRTFATSKVKALSTVGAGDAYNAAFLSKYLTGSDVYRSAEYANRVATYKVAHNIVVLPDMIDN